MTQRLTFRENTGPVTFEVVLKDRLNEERDLTGKSVRLVVKRDPDDEDSKAFVDVNGTILSPATDGKVQFVLNGDNLALPPGSYEGEILIFGSASPPAGERPVDSEDVIFSITRAIRRTT